MFRSQQIIIREYVCTSLKLLNYLKNTEFKILKIIPGVVTAKRVAGIRGDPLVLCVRTYSTTRVTGIFMCFNIEIGILDQYIVECEVHWLVFIIQ